MRLSSFSRGRRVFRDTQDGRKHRPDYVILVLASALLLIGAVVVYAIGPGLTGGSNLSTNYYSSKQLFAITLGVLAFIISIVTPLKKWTQFQPIIIGAALCSAIAVRFIGEEINGAHRWIQVGGMSFQTAELVKLALILWLARFLADKRRLGELQHPNTFKVLGVVTASIVFIVAGLQSDLGSASVMMAIVGVSAFIAGMPLQKMALALVGLTLIVGLAVAVTPYRRGRVATFLNPTADCQDQGYQACQALITIGSGGIVGKGLGHSVQAYGYLPFPANDSIYAIVSEKFGFIGATVMIGIFWLLFKRLVDIARATTDDYKLFLVVGVLVWLSTQMIINVGAMIGLLPLKGITLPFVSYGGTSIIFIMIAMGLVFQISKYTDLSLVKAKRQPHNAFESKSSQTPRFRRFREE